MRNFRRHSLKTRITVVTLTIFVAGVWSLSFQLSRVLRSEMQRLLGEQQASTVAIVAAQINAEMGSRLQALEVATAGAAPAMRAGPAAIQSLIEQRPVLASLFNGGIIAYDSKGIAIAEVPLEVGRVGTSYMARDYLAGALNEGSPSVGRPLHGSRLGAPVFVMAVPIRDAGGAIVGALGGVINLSRPNFLDRLTENRYGTSGYYLLVDPKSRLVVTGSDKRRIMTALPAHGVNVLIDRHVQGVDDTAVMVNGVGDEVLASASRIPVAGWFLVAALPAAEAFAPIRAVQMKMLQSVLLLTLLAGGLTWWILRRQLAPMMDTVTAVAAMSDEGRPLQPLPAAGSDEIGQMVGGVNRLLEVLRGREADLQASDRRFRDMVNTTDGIVWEADATTFTFTFVSEKAERLLGFPLADWLEPGFWVDHLHVDDKVWAPEFCTSCTLRLEPHDFEYRFIAKSGATIWLRDIVTVVAENGEPRWLRGLMVDITKNKQLETVLRASEARYRALTRSAHDAIVTADRDGRIVDWNHGAEAVFGYTEAEALGHPLTLLIPERYRDGHSQAFGRGMSKKPNRSATRELVGRYKDGNEFPLELSIATWETAEGQFVTSIMRDITERKTAEADLRIAAAAFESQEAKTITDANGIILKVNKSFSVITGYGAVEVVGRTPAVLKSGRQDAEFYQDMWNSIRRDKFWQGEIWNRRKSGEVFPELLTISAVVDDDGQVTHYVAAFTDITQTKQAQDRIHHLAFNDPLTDLPNRRLLMDRLKQALAVGLRSRHRGALMLIDLDNFKTLNDTVGHDKGDLLLKEVARRLVDCVREGDTVARLGGDEFVVILEGLGEHADEAATQAETVGEKIFAALSRRYLLGDHETRSTPSIGVTLFGSRDDSIDELLKQAELAMYRAKEAGRNTVRFFNPEMQATVAARASLEADLRNAIRQREFVLYYQPQVEGSGRLTGAEALIRWQHPRHGTIGPARFIPLAEDNGLILPLGHWVLETACARLAAWATDPQLKHLTLAVNVSARQFRQHDFVDMAKAVIDRSGVDPQRLKLELTESLLLDDVEETIAKMTTLKAHGVSFSLDDFGTGYSSLAYLKRLPLDQLKIDQSFVRDVLMDPNDAVIAKTVVALARSLGIGVIAEGVETAEQRDFLAQSGCYAYQGYFFSRPLPLADFEDFARTG